jgi:hypothetical protein
MSVGDLEAQEEFRVRAIPLQKVPQTTKRLTRAARALGLGAMLSTGWMKLRAPGGGTKPRHARKGAPDGWTGSI